MYAHVRPLLGVALRLRLRLLLLNRKEQLEFRRQFLLGVEAVREVYPADSAIGMYLHTQRLDVVRAISTARKVRQIELDLVPPLVQTHRHCADKRLHARRALVIRSTKPP